VSASGNDVDCKDIAPLLVFYVCDEVSADEREQIERHLSNCKACSEQLAEEQEFRETLIDAPQAADQLDSSGILLAQCRSELAEALDDLSMPPVEKQWRPFGWLRRWMALRPAWSGAFLVLFGILVGTQILPWMQNRSSDNQSGQAMNVVAEPSITEDLLSKMAVSEINFVPSSGSAPGTVQLQLRAEQPLVLSGNVEDSRMRRVLTYVVENGERFDAGVRLDCMEALKAAARDQQVRQALIIAAHKDQNPAVRMKALESLRDSASDNAVRQALLDRLEHDANPGVRVEAVNVLVGSLQNEESNSPEVAQEVPVARTPEQSSGEEDESLQRVVRVLQQLQRQDPNRYVRLRSAAALRQIGPREVQ